MADISEKNKTLMKHKSIFNQEQKSILEQSGINLQELTEHKIKEIIDFHMLVPALSTNELLEFLKIANALYRGGSPIIGDADYDAVYLAELRKREPNHQYLSSVEPEATFEGIKRDLPEPMLSTEKRTSKKSIEDWIERKQEEAKGIGLDINKLIIRVTPKLDGYAAYDDGKYLYTRGDGMRGTDITRVFERGLNVAGDERGRGPGEIVVDKEYFEKYLSNHFENARNFQAAIIKEKTLDPFVEEAIKEKVAIFYPFSELPAKEVSISELLQQFDQIMTEVWNSVPFDVDGVILEVTDEHFKKYVGSTSQFHKWQVAYKINVEKAQVKVISVIPQTSRSGRVTPVAKLEPTKLGGVTISRATAHNYGMVKKKGIGSNAIIELIRSGMVIPKIEKVIIKSTPDIPKTCPSCNSTLIWDSDNLICTNVENCQAQIINTIEHFFKTLRNIDGFGSATIEKLYQSGIRNVYSIYLLKETDFERIGFGDKQSQNLIAELQRSRTEHLEDWRFLAAFGVHRLGIVNCQTLLQHVNINDIFQLTKQYLTEKKIFAVKTANIIVQGIKDIENEFAQLKNLSFNITYTRLLSEVRKEGGVSPIDGKHIVFTGKMQHGRDEMEKEARLLRAKVAKTVSSRTDFLVTGENVGHKKIESAEKKGVQVITEVEYLKMINKNNG
ncbi:MAG: BRCT domain-containing protein [Thermodesulfovibrionia bacterium]|nr:BRCT domain-containing protein [Thermodesulfovibrionia bacterium]